MGTGHHEWWSAETLRLSDTIMFVEVKDGIKIARKKVTINRDQTDQVKEWKGTSGDKI